MIDSYAFIIQALFLFFLLFGALAVVYVSRLALATLDRQLDRLQDKLDSILAAQCEQNDRIETIIRIVLRD